MRRKRWRQSGMNWRYSWGYAGNVDHFAKKQSYGRANRKEDSIEHKGLHDIPAPWDVLDSGRGHRAGSHSHAHAQGRQHSLIYYHTISYTYIHSQPSLIPTGFGASSLWSAASGVPLDQREVPNDHAWPRYWENQQLYWYARGAPLLLGGLLWR